MSVSAVIGGIASQIVGKTLDYNFQRKLYQQQTNYPELMQRMQAAGISPAAAAAGLSGSPGNSMPSFSGAGTLDSNISGIISAMAQKRESETNEKRAQVQNDFDRLKMFWQPKLWRSEINESYSRMMKNASESKYFKELSGYYEQSKLALEEMRPWNLNNAISTFVNSLATFDEIVSRIEKNKQETKTSSALEGLYKAESEKTYSEKFNIDMQGFALMWENDLRNAGINPNQPFFESIKRLMFQDPQKAKKLMDGFLETLQNIDAKLKSDLGEHYKRNIAIGVGLYGLHKGIQKSRDRALDRLYKLSSIAGNIIPFAGGSAPISSSVGQYDMISGASAIQRAKDLGLVLPY